MHASVVALAGVAATLLASCGVSSLANFAGFGSTERAEASSWTTVSHRNAPAASASTRPEPAVAGDESVGRFRLLTYNVAGLPQLFSPTTPRANIPLVSPLLNAYDVALVQEDFSYHHELSRDARHAYRSQSMRPRSFVGDGLNQFSRFEFAVLHRVRWERCNGYVSSATDCLADKGFSFSKLRLAPDLDLHLYNLHADAGMGRLDVGTRRHNFKQLARYIEQHSNGEAVIVAGDTNLRTFDPGDERTLTDFLEAVGLHDACRLQGCLNLEGLEYIDRVMLRGSPRVALAVIRLSEDPAFVDAAGLPLSDHPAMRAEVRWRRIEPEAIVAHLHGSESNGPRGAGPELQLSLNAPTATISSSSVSTTRSAPAASSSARLP
jgi:hypothetical protein